MSDLEKRLSVPATICLSIDDKASMDPVVVDHPLPSTSLESGASPSIAQTSTRTFTEGGLRGQLTVFGGFLALFCASGPMYAFGTFQSWYAAHQLHHMPASTISWIGSLQLWIFFFAGAPIGRLFDAYGPTGLMIAGTICYVTSMMITSISTHYYQFILAQGVLFGLGVGLLFYPSLASIPTYYSKWYGTALGIAVAGSGLGGVVYPIMLQRLFEQVGFGWGVRISGLLGTAGCVIATMSVSRAPVDVREDRGPYFDLKTVADMRYALLAAGSSFVALGLFVPFFYIVEYARHLSIAEHMAFYILAVMNAGNALGRIAPGYFSDTFGRYNLLIPAAFFSGLSCIVCWLLARSLATLIFFSAVYGFFSGAFTSLINPCVVQITDMRQIGTRIGWLYTIISFPSLLGGPAAGALLTRYHASFTPMIIFSGSTIMVGSVFILSSKLVINSKLFARV